MDLKSKLEKDTFNAALLDLVENEYVEFYTTAEETRSGYKLNAKKEIQVCLLLSAVLLSGKRGFSLSQYLPG